MRGQLNDKQQELLSKLSIGLKNDQCLWLSGYFAARGAAESNLPKTVGNEDVANTPLTILFGTDTGHSEEIARRLKDQALKQGLDVELEIMEDYNKSDLKSVQNLAIVVSTHGDGEAPLNAFELLEYLQGNRVPDLKHLNFTVLALGDRSYKKFCQTGIDFQQALLAAGAKEMVPLTKCDVAYKDDAEAWQGRVLDVLKADVASGPRTRSEDADKQTKRYDRQQPYKSRVLDKVRLSGRDSSKEVYHFELALGDSGLSYEPGDTVGIYASNPVNLVDQMLEKLACSPETQVQLNDGAYTLREVLLNHLEITVLTREVIKGYATQTKQEALLKEIENERFIDDYLYGHDVLDLLTDFPAQLNPIQLTEILRELPARMYSIASSQATSPSELHITVSAVRYKKNERKRLGACSTFLIDQLQINDEVSIFIEKNRGFKLPGEKDAPVIMVGAGTGIAPYRGFLQQRQREKSKGKNWLVFGNQNFYSDFLYQTEWQKHLQKGILTKIDLAFSRDQDEKIYVQHRLKENSKEVYHWLEDGASLYVCGDKDRMARDVHQTLIDIVKVEGQKSKQEAEAYLKQLKKERRYQLDVY